MDEDPVQEAMGDFGRWQLPTVMMVFVYKLFLSWHALAIIFLAPNVDFKCSASNVTDPCSDECHQYEYDDSVFKRTIISEWDLVCERRNLALATQSIVMLGILVGSIMFGSLSDWIGRRIPFYITVIVLVATGIATAFVPWFWLFMVMKFVNAVAVGGGLVVSFVNMMEIVGKPFRESLGITSQMPYYLAHITMPALAYYCRDWRQYQMVYSIAGTVCLPFLFFMHESPRWLFSTGQVAKAAKLLTKAAKINKMPTEGIKENLQAAFDRRNFAEHGKKTHVWDLFRTRYLCIHTLCICFNWFSSGMSGFGIAQYTGYMGGDIFVNISVSAAFEIPAGIICVMLTKYWGRKPTQIIGNLLTVISMFIIAFLPEEKSSSINWATLILVSVGMSGTCLSSANAYLYGAELFPTIVRSAGIGLCSMFSRIGAMISPFIANMKYPWICSLIFGAVSAIAAILCLFLPETKGQHLPETMEDGENFGKMNI